MNAWAFGTLTLIAAICTVGRLANAALEHWFRERWDERHYAPQLPVRRGRIIDVETRNVPPAGRQGGRAADLSFATGYQSTPAKRSPTH